MEPTLGNVILVMLFYTFLVLFVLLARYWITIKKRIDDIGEMVKNSISDGNWNYDHYMLGMTNGLLLAHATLKADDPEFVQAPKIWLNDEVELETEYIALINMYLEKQISLEDLSIRLIEAKEENVKKIEERRSRGAEKVGYSNGREED